MAPYRTRSLLGKPVQALPNVFRYVKYIKEMDGFVGCYRGYFPKITGQICGAVAAAAVTKNFNSVESFNPIEDEMSDEEKISYLKRSLTKDIVGRTVTIVVSHPFVVISGRMMAQFVGGEDIYNGFFSSIVEIYKEQGLSGFFSGLFPRWLGELTTLILSSFIVFAINNYVIHDRELKAFTTPTINFVANSLTYPFCVVSSCMAVNNCGLAAGLPPNMPIYKNWAHCWVHLSRQGLLNRGSSLLIRYYHGPSRSSNLNTEINF
ncbi:mitochondrial carrier homolog 2-like isoform X2 [Rhodnius prolixus]